MYNFRVEGVLGYV